MKWWMKVLAVALAAVVGVVPALTQVSCAQVVPIGEELTDDELCDIVGELKERKWWEEHFYAGFLEDLAVSAMFGACSGYITHWLGACPIASSIIGFFMGLGFLAGRWPRFWGGGFVPPLWM